MIRLGVFLIGLTVFGGHSAQEQHDSYLDALRMSQEAETPNDSRDAREEFSSGYSDNSLGLTSGYDYTPPKPQYGPPSKEFGTGYSASAPYPPSSYGHPVYGPPKPINMYNFAGPPHAYNLPEEHWLLDKLKFKLDLFTIGKLLIKLIIFKKIVKFIALICLLLWLPKFHSKHMKMEHITAEDEDEDDDEDDDDRRQFRNFHPADNRLNELTRFTMTALNGFQNKYSTNCQDADEIYCRFNAMVDSVDDHYPYTRIMKLYLTSDDSANAGAINDQKSSALDGNHRRVTEAVGRTTDSSSVNVTTEATKTSIRNTSSAVTAHDA